MAESGRRSAGPLDTLAAAYAADARFERAVAILDEALRLAPPPDLADGLQARRALYRAGRPFRLP